MDRVKSSVAPVCRLLTFGQVSISIEEILNILFLHKVQIKEAINLNFYKIGIHCQSKQIKLTGCFSLSEIKSSLNRIQSSCTWYCHH